MIHPILTSFFQLDALAIIMMTLLAFIGVCVASFACRYLKGDKQFLSFFIQLVLLFGSVAVMVSAAHLILLFFAWCVSNLLLVRLMIHKSSWKAARASGMLAAKNYLFGALCIALAFVLFYLETGQTHIQSLNQQHIHASGMLAALLMLLIGAMTQSAIYPFHRWLTSSLNSPTPVSAIMHAGLVNGGGFLLVRFAPLYLQYSYLLTVIFIIGITTALLGTLWKLMQSDVKRMLACSTMGQMGFMLVQCGLGLFPAAVAHLVWHGFFKAFLFLASGSSAQEKRVDLGYPPKALAFIAALLCGLAGSLGFAVASGKSWLAGDTTFVLMGVSFLAASQFALPLLRYKTLQHFMLSLTATSLFGLVYGMSVHLIIALMVPMQLMQAQPLNAFHIAGLIALTLAWLSILFLRNANKNVEQSTWRLKGYVLALNASQPHPKTITAHRNQYRYG